MNWILCLFCGHLTANRERCCDGCLDLYYAD